MSRQYNFRDTLIYFLGNIIDTGIISVTAVPNADNGAAVVSADGDVTMQQFNDNNYTVTLVLAQSSPANDVLSDIFRLSKEVPGGGTGTFSIQHLQGTSLLTSNFAKIVRPPDFGFQSEVQERTWTLFVENPDVHWGSSVNFGV